MRPEVHIRREWRRALVLSAVLLPGLLQPVLAAAASPTFSTTTPPAELLLDVHVNGEDEHETTLFLQTGNDLWVERADLQHWRLLLPAVQSYAYEGGDFYPLSAIKGFTYRIDTATQTVWITVAPEAFAPSVIAGFQSGSAPPQPPPPGAFLNYNFFASRSTGSTVTDAFTELGLFNHWGILTDTYLGNNLNQPTKQWVRLETTFTQDHPDDLATLRLGDSITNGGMTGDSVRFGGIQWGTNFATQPGLATLPLPSLTGSALTPSTVQLYVNGVLQQSQNVPPGPFTIPQLPVASGPSTITLVVRDLNGHQQIVNVPFYGAISLLAKGLNDYSFSFGEERQNFGVDDNDYGPRLASFMFRRGFTNGFTGELRAESEPGLDVAGLGGFVALGTAGVLNLAAAASHSDSLGSGVLRQVGYQYTGQVFGLGFNVQKGSPDFDQPGYVPGITASTTQVSANASMYLGPVGSVSVGYLRQQDPVLGEIKFSSLNYTKSLGEVGFLSLNVIHDLTGKNGNSAFLLVTLPLGEQRSASLGVQRQSGTDMPFAQIQQSLPAGTGFGYRLASEFGHNGESQGELDYQNNVGSYTLQALHTTGQTIYTAGVDGSIGILGGDLFMARQLTNSFAVVEVPGQANVDVYAQNQVVARTNGSGYAVIPQLNAYQNNVIGYDPRNLPLDTDISDSNMNVVPYYRSGVLVRFPVATVHGVTFTLKLKDGTAVPAGAVIRVPGQAKTFPVGYDGEAYVTGLEGRTLLKASWGTHACSFAVIVPTNSQDPLPDLGVYTCEVSKP